MINTSIGLIGVAKQSAKGTAASTPSFVHGITGGKVYKPDRSTARADVACGVRAGTDSYVESIVPGADYDTYGYADALPLYFYAAMGSIASSANAGSGMSGYYDHVITLGDLLPYLTIWGRTGGEYTCVEGCKVDQLEMEFEGNAPVEFGITALGLDDTVNLEGMPGSVSPSCFDGYFVPTGGTFKINTGGATPTAAPVTGGALTLANNCTAHQFAGQVKPGDVEEGKLTSSGNVKVKPADMSEFYKMLTGAADGTTSTGAMVYGSFEWNFKHSKDAKMSMKVAATNVPFTAEWPDVDPNGGAAEIEFSFEDIGVAAASGSPVTVTITNDTASYSS